jgi:uncharacterized membrane protein
MAKKGSGLLQAGLGELVEALPKEQLVKQGRELAVALAERAVGNATDRVGDLTDHLLDYAEHGGSLFGGKSGDENGKSKGGDKGGGSAKKIVNIVEEIDIGVPVRVAYNQWTLFQQFPKFTKRVESVEQESEEKLSWKAGIFLSRRTWESTIRQQVPDEMIVWQSKGDKGWVDGTVTFHELAPNLTRVLLVLEYHPRGLFERTGNLWRAQGRRVRLELKNFRRYVMTQSILDPEGVEGWRGEIRDGEVVKSHEDALAEESGDQGEESEDQNDEDRDETDEDEDRYPEDEQEEEDEDRYPEDEQEEEDEEYPEDEEDEYEEEEEPEDEYDEDEEPEDEYDEAEEEDEDEAAREPAPRSRRRAPARR